MEEQKSLADLTLERERLNEGMTEDRVPTPDDMWEPPQNEPAEPTCEERGHRHHHPTGSPYYHDECDITDRAMTENRVPTQSLEGLLRAWRLNPANFIESLTGWGYEIRRAAQPAPPLDGLDELIEKAHDPRYSDEWVGNVFRAIAGRGVAARLGSAMTENRVSTRTNIILAIEAELASAYAKHGDLPWGRHEFYAILLEEVEETWDAIKADEHLDRVAKEAIQVAAMCIRYLETGDRYRGAFPFDRGGPQ